MQIVGYMNTNKDHLHGQKWNSYSYKFETLVPFKVLPLWLDAALPAMLPLLETLSKIFNRNAVKGCQRFSLNLCNVSRTSVSKAASSMGTKKVARNKVMWVGVMGHTHHFVFMQNLLDVQGHSATFLHDFITGCRAIYSHSSKTSDLLFVLEKQTPCALAHQHQKKKSTLSWNWSELAEPFLVWTNLVTSSDLTAPLTQGHSHSINSHQARHT